MSLDIRYRWMVIYWCAKRTDSKWKFPLTVCAKLNTAFPLLYGPSTLWFSPFQHRTIPVCLPRRTFLALLILLPLSPHDCGQEWCWKTEWWKTEGSVLPCQRSGPRTCLGRLRRRKNCRCARMQISQRGDACLRWYAGHLYMNQKTCYLMEGSANSTLTTATIPPQASGQV